MCRIFEIHLKLRDKQFKIMMYIYIYIVHCYENMMVTANKKSICIHTKMNPSTTLKIVIKSQEEKKSAKMNVKQLTKWQ